MWFEASQQESSAVNGGGGGICIVFRLLFLNSTYKGVSEKSSYTKRYIVEPLQNYMLVI